MIRRDPEIHNALEVVLIRLRIGHTLRRAVEGLPHLKADADLQSKWDRLFRGVEEGRIAADSAVAALRQQLETEARVLALVDEKLFMPRLQSKVVAGLCVAMFLALQYFLHGSQIESPWWSAPLAFALIVSSYFLSRATLRRAERPWVFFSSWLRFLSVLSGRLEYGQTLAQALHEASAEAQPDAATTPVELRARLKRLHDHVRTGSLPPPRERTRDRMRAPTPKAHIFAGLLAWMSRAPGQWESARANEQLGWIEDLAREGEPVSPLLKALLPSALESFERRVKRESEKIAAQAMLPLFAFNLPAFFLLLLAPLLSFLTKF